MNKDISIFDILDNDYTIGIMFQDFRHHNIKNGKPTLDLLDMKGKKLNYDANLFYPTKKGLVITEYVAGIMVGFCYLEVKDNNIIEVEKKPYGTLRNIKNHIYIPKNIANTYIPILIGKGKDTWFFWKALINSNDLDATEEYTFPTLTTNQERIPNVGMKIYKEVLNEKD